MEESHKKKKCRECGTKEQKAVKYAYVTKKSFTFCLKLENCVIQICLRQKVP